MTVLSLLNTEGRKDNMNKDLSPIDQKWILMYCDKYIEVAKSLPEGNFRQAIFMRVSNAMDLLEAWQKRNNPIK